MEALTSDEQWAAAVLKNPPPETKPTRRMADWSPELEMLSNLYDRMGELIRAVVASGGGRPGNAAPAPRPTTAVERVRHRQREARHRALVARVVGHRTAAAPVPASAPAPPAVEPVGAGTEWLRRQRGVRKT